jgi:hypothetical protein
VARPGGDVRDVRARAWPVHPTLGGSSPSTSPSGSSGTTWPSRRHWHRVFPTDGTTFDELSCERMPRYRAKQDGRHTHRFSAATCSQRRRATGTAERPAQGSRERRARRSLSASGSLPTAHRRGRGLVRWQHPPWAS